MHSADYLLFYFNMCAMLIVGQGQVSEFCLCLSFLYMYCVA